MSQNWGDETKCTYAQGYIDQPVYSCRECSERTGKQVRKRSYRAASVSLYYSRLVRCTCSLVADPVCRWWCSLASAMAAA